MRSDESFAAYVAARWSMLYRLATLLVGEDRAEDLAQRALVRAYLTWPDLEEHAATDDLVKGILAAYVAARWTGQPQPAIVRLAAEGSFAGPVLDAGCGTGENALHVASLGVPVLGVDVAETALAIARAKAAERGIEEVEFAAADALQLKRLGRVFETVLDCGLFHTFDGGERPGYVASLASVIEHGGTLHVLCFSDEGLDTGPHPVSQEELRSAFSPSDGWDVAAIVPDRVQTRYHDDAGAAAWLATIQRI